LAERQISAFLLPMLFNLDPLGARGVESVELAGAATVLDLGSLGTVTLTGVAVSNLAADDFVYG
jgi:hypothetical protein